MKLSELRCDSDVLPEIFSQLSKICHNIKSLDIEFKDYPSSELTELISSQNNLEHLSLSTHMDALDIQIVILIPLTKQFNTITRLTLQNYEPISFIVNLTKLEELSLTYYYSFPVDFEVLRYAIFPNLRDLKFYRQRPKTEMLSKFLENNGKNLKSLHISGRNNDSLNSIIVDKLCPNLKFKLIS